VVLEELVVEVLVLQSRNWNSRNSKYWWWGGGASRWSANGGAGGKGVVILSMPLASFSNTTTGSPTESDDGTTKVLIFNGDGSYTA
jgi:hypothetical protein